MNVRTNLVILMVLSICLNVCVASFGGEVSGELKTWHKATISFEGPETSENANPNPFTDYRLNVTFSKGDSQYVVPGYFAADGNAANTSATSGNIWRVHFAPDSIGPWTYSVSFRKGNNVAVSEKPDAGESAGFMDGETGVVTITASDKTGRDFRSKGRLSYVGKHHLQFEGTKDYFLKCGADAPENLLSYADFDGDFKTDGKKDQFIKTWEPHIRDWKNGDPSWQDGKGKGLIGAINYLASEGMNVFSFLTLNIIGDDQNVFPYTDYDERLRIDVSRMDQWEIVFEHGTQNGMYLHFKTQEAENQELLDGGALGVERKLYYRELIARFSHHLALNWNLGEENGKWGNHEGQNTEERRAMAQYFHDHDPYQHNIVIHNGQPFDDLLGDQSALTGASVQTNKPDFSQVHGAVLNWIRKSAKAGKPWVVACDEPGDASHSLLTDGEDPEHNDARKNALWGTMLAGGAGIEWYFGYKHPHSDLTCEDWRSRDLFWDQCRYALEFFDSQQVPFWTMTSADELTAAEDDYCFYQDGEIYVVYLKNGGETTLDLKDHQGAFSVKWFNPRKGGKLQTGSVSQINGPGQQSIGTPPNESTQDWTVLIKKK
ncbi:MAG: DUF5060 domain-containing protein [Candidatus Hinthialibacter antarcticus]|nr:DUF5060 domain-containing protein [Candidatus Hinthialibacter antarcticus]